MLASGDQGEALLRMIDHALGAAATLASAYDAAGGPDRSDTDRPLVALLGGGAPLELILAAGCTPQAIRPQPAPHERAARYLRPSAPLEIAGRLEALLSGSLYEAALALMTSRFEIDAILYHSAKEILRRGEGEAFPPLHLHVLAGQKLESARAFSVGEARRLANRLAAASGVAVTGAALVAAVDRTNAIRRQVARLQQLRLSGAVSGVLAMQLLGAGRLTPVETYADRLQAAIQDLPAAAPARRPRLLLVSSAELFHTHLHQALEDSGAVVVAEDGDWGARAFGPEITLGPEIAFDGEPLEIIVQHYLDHTPGLAVYPHTARLAWIYAEASRPEIDAVVFHIPLDEAPLGWDYPRLKAYAAALGKPSLLLREDPLTPDGRAAITAASADFLQQARLEPTL